LKKVFASSTLTGNRKKDLWRFPWGYSESFIIAAGLVITGFLIEAFTKGKGLIKPQWPYNLVAGLAFAGLLTLTHRLFKKHPLVKWLSSIPACISSISLFCLLALLLGIIPQNDRQYDAIISGSGLTHISRSWPFLLSQIYFLTTLGLVILRRAFPLKRKNTGFLLNHSGLWLIITAALLGSGDLKRFRMVLREDETPNQIAVDENLRLFVIPFSIRLVDFNIEEYNPKMAIYNKEIHKYIADRKKPDIVIEKDLEISMHHWNIAVMEFILYSYMSGDSYEPSSVKGSAPAALIFAVNRITKDTVSGWITCGSYMIPPLNLDLDDTYSLVMKTPESRKYCSLLEIYEHDKNTGIIKLEVNKPVSVKHWKLYQAGYNEKMGKWSDISIIELVRDPWLPLVYFGIFMLLAGAVYIFWIGRKIRD
jgi:hypothetical protein